jgi:hypothetical protein
MMKKKVLMTLVTLLLLLAFGTVVLAQSGYLLNRRVIGSGGGTLKAGSYSLTGTTGQPEAGQSLANGSYSLRGGFWQNSNRATFLPMIIR